MYEERKTYKRTLKVIDYTTQVLYFEDEMHNIFHWCFRQHKNTIAYTYFMGEKFGNGSKLEGRFFEMSFFILSKKEEESYLINRVKNVQVFE